MKKAFLLLILIIYSFSLYSQIVPGHPDLGLNGVVTWIDATHIKVDYDWSDDSQLLDWGITSGSTLVRDNGTVTITDGSINSVRAMLWKQGIKCSKINAKNAAPLSSAGHLNFYSNLTSFSGYYLPNPGLGAVLITYNNFWTNDGANVGNIGAPLLVEGVARDYEYSVSSAGMTIKSSIDEVVYAYNTPCSPELDRKIALGGWGGNTKWGAITIEGEIAIPWQYEPVPSDAINIQSNGAVFAPVIEVTGTPLIEWIFDDSTTSASGAPVKNYGSAGSRHNYLKVTPWSSLIGINVGYDAADGGYGGFAMVANQNILGFQNLILVKSSLQYLCASYNPLTELNLKELTALKFVELYRCQNLVTVSLGTHPVLERLCVEDCNVDSLDLSGCSALEDLRGALNQYTSINWGSIGQALWHICIRDNPQITVNIPALTQFPVLRELLNWNTNQTGAFVCHSSVMQKIDSYNNHYTSADISGCTSLIRFTLSGSHLASLDLGTAYILTNIQLKDCGLTESQMDYVLHTLDGAGRFNGYLDLTLNAAPSEEGLIHLDNLKGKGWVILPVASITVTGAGGASTISTDNGTLQLSAEVFPADATNRTVTWSIINGTGQAAISATGLVTAVANGTVIARAIANDGSYVYGSLVITLSNQVVPVTGISVSGAAGATTITTDNGTLQLSAAVLPANATDKTVTWSVVNGTGQATISATGLVTAIDNGTVTARATANDGSGVYGTLVITNSNQVVPVTGITVSGAAGATTITTDNGTLQLSVAVLPANATDKTVTWSVVNGTGQATISATGLVTAIDNGTVTARATANDGSGVSGELILTISILTSINIPGDNTDPLKIIVNRHELKILLTDAYISWKACLYNLQGVLLLSKLVESDLFVFDISSMSSGIYIVVLSDGEHRRVAKVIRP